MSDRRLAAGCLLGSFEGTDAPAWLLQQLRDGLGGVLLFAQNVVDDEQVAALCATLRAANPGVVIAIDEEGGDVTRLDARRGSDMPAPAAFGAVDDVDVTHGGYAALGARIARLGIDLTLAPCADINSNPANPVIGVRSFGGTADIVGRHAAAAVAGFRTGGVGAAVKHFPGHGDTSEDTHLGVARIDLSLAELEAREIRPFTEVARAGVDAVMTAHVVASAIDDAPVSLSAPWTKYLREVVGFDGVIVTDALDMDGVAEGRGIDGVCDAAVRALAAGADLLCLGSNFTESMTEAVVDRVADALRAGRIDRSQLEAGHTRIARLRSSALRHGTTAHEGLFRDTESVAAVEVWRDVAAQAISCTGCPPSGPYAVLECRPRLSMAYFNVAWGVAELVRERGWTMRQISPSDDIGECVDSFVSAAEGTPVVVIVRDIDVSPWQRDVIAAVGSFRSDLVVAEMGWPSATPPSCGTYIVTHGAARGSAAALVDRLSTGQEL